MREDEKPVRSLISNLLNSVYFFIEIVFILRTETGKFRLLGFHHGDVLIDREYDTVRGAQISFSRQFGYKLWKKGIKAEWSPFYAPDFAWLNEKITREAA